MESLQNSTRLLRKVKPMLLKFLKIEETFENRFYKVSITLIPKEKKIQYKGNYKTTLPDEQRYKNPQQNLANWIQEHLKKRSSWTCSRKVKMVQQTQISKCNLQHKLTQGQKPHEHFIWQNHFMTKVPVIIRVRRT